MPKLLEEVKKFSEDTMMKFATDKCKVMIINKKEEDCNQKAKIKIIRKRTGKRRI